GRGMGPAGWGDRSGNCSPPERSDGMNQPEAKSLDALERRSRAVVACGVLLVAAAALVQIGFWIRWAELIFVGKTGQILTERRGDTLAPTFLSLLFGFIGVALLSFPTQRV